MILHPAILALLITSLLTSSMVLYAGGHGIRILARWDLRSGSELQLNLERRTYLISTILSYVLIGQLFSLFLYIHTADNLHGLFTGAMCAAGTLNANGFGYPALFMKTVNFLLAGVWLIVNHADIRGYDYPLLRVKYALLLAMVPLVVLETFFLCAYFAGLHADVVTSCCGSLFNLDRPGMSGDLVGLPGLPMTLAFYGGMAATAVGGLAHYFTGRGAYPFAILSFVTFGTAVAALISFICLYFYELPTHHCPFCILQKEYGYVGYLLYGCLLGGAAAGLGVGALTPWRGRTTMARIIPPLQRRLTVTTLALYLLFTLIVSWRMLFSSFRVGD